MIAHEAAGQGELLPLAEADLHAIGPCRAELGLEPQLRNEAFALELSSRTADFREGLQAFVERRPPDFGGR